MKKNITPQGPASSSPLGEPKSLRIKSGVRSGDGLNGSTNHNETALRAARAKRGWSYGPV